jgi:cytochrome P450
MGRLYAELVEREQKHSRTRPFPKWDEVSELPYLDACINEAVRLHPPFCLPFERVVPPGGITIGTESVYLPEGTVVGMNPYVVNRHKQTFGEDADEWNPDRWLGRDEQQRKKMEQSVLTVSSFFFNYFYGNFDATGYADCSQPVRSRETCLSREACRYARNEKTSPCSPFEL